MSKNIGNISQSEKKLILDTLKKVTRELSGPKSAEEFVFNILTESEQLIIGRRLLIAERLLAGQTQFQIMNDLQVSPNTLTRTREWLEGQVPEYSEVFKQSQKIEKERRKSRNRKRGKPFEHPNPASFAGMQKKYPLHFLLFTLAGKALKKNVEKD